MRHQTFNDIIEKYNPYHDELGRFTTGDKNTHPLKGIAAVFDLHFKSNGESRKIENLTKQAKSETDKYFQVTGLHSDGKIFSNRSKDGKKTESYTAKELALIILRSKTYKKGTPIKIYSCEAGKKKLAQDLANILGVEVKAPTGKLALTESSKYKVIKRSFFDLVYQYHKGEEGWKSFWPC